MPPENTAWAVRAGQVVNVQQLVFPRAASLSAATSLEIHVSGHVHHLHRFQSPVLFGAGDTPVLAKAVLRLRIT
ncbi:MAG TPA: hypothetical protein VH328_14180 [Burkholderiaceae bacterium]|nr:hypothetical protein [Burkholderiaceae bacterium]